MKTAVILHNVLYKTTSQYVTDKGESIGLGLYSSIGFKTGDHICKFIGEIVTTQEFAEWTANGRGGYGLHYTSALVYDCYRFREVCMASMSNTGRNLRHVVTRQSAQSNARVKVDMMR